MKPAFQYFAGLFAASFLVGLTIFAQPQTASPKKVSSDTQAANAIATRTMSASPALRAQQPTFQPPSYVYSQPTLPVIQPDTYTYYDRYYDYNYRPSVGHRYVNGYFRKNGTYVSGHYRTNRDDSFWNNWSSKGNVNPYTGKVGTRRPYRRR